jgi:hypothetical protein
MKYLQKQKHKTQLMFEVRRTDRIFTNKQQPLKFMTDYYLRKILGILQDSIFSVKRLK